jgi:O-acetylhomoserine/O-acetylserine sulfhydrylase-like pyridoxal-dependent enzyme
VTKYLGGHSDVVGGHIVVNESTDLPEGTELTLILVDASDDMTIEERADLEAEMERGRADLAAGRGMSGDELLARVRAL